MNPLTCHGRRRAWMSAAFALACTASVPAAAQSIWIGGTDDNLSTVANWSPAAPVSGLTAWLVYDNTALSFTPAIDIPFTARRVDLVGGTPHSLSGALTLNGAGPLIFATGATHTLALTLALGADATVNNASDLLSTGGFTGPVSLTKTGAGRLTVAGVLDNTGTVTVSAGTLRIGDGVTGPASVAPAAFVNNAALEFDSPLGVTMNAGTSGTGSLTVGGGGLQALGPDLTHQGATTVNAGSLVGRVFNNAPLTIAAGATVQANDSTVGSLAGAGTLNSNGFGPVIVGGDNTSTTFSGTLGASGPFEKVGAGTQTLTGALSLGGTVTVNGGTLRIGDGVTGPGAVSPSAFIINAALEFDSPLGVTMIAGTSGTGSLTVGGGGLQALGPDLTHQGATTVNAGSLIGRIVNNAPLTIAAGATVQANGSTVGSLAGAGTLNSNSAGDPVRVGGDNTSTTFSGNLGASGPFEKVGAGTLTLSGASTNGGTKTVVAGSLLFTGSIPGSFIVNAGATLGGTGTITGPVAIDAGGTLAPGLSPGIINSGDLSLAGALVVEIEGTTVGTQYDQTNVTGTVTIAGGTLALAGAYAPFSGDAFVIVANDGADAVSGTFTGLPEGATIAFNGATLQISYVGGTGNDITLTALAPTSTTWNGAGANDNWGTGANWVGGASPASGSATIVTFPTASARFAPVVDAPWTVNRMDVTGTTAYAMTGQAITFAGAAPQLNASGAAHSLANPLTLSAAVAVNNASALTLSGAIGGASGITKTGAGILSLTGTSTFAGGTTVNGGTLFVNGTIPGPVAVNAGATLGGTGTITGAVAINAGGTLAPGLSPGLTNTGDLNLAGAFLVEIEGTTVGTQYDQTNVTGTVTIAGGTLTLAGAYVPVAGNAFTIIANDGADAVTGTFAGLAEGATVTLNGVTLVISYVGGTGNDVVLTAQAAAVVAPIPTLSQWGVILLAMLLAAVGMVAARRR